METTCLQITAARLRLTAIAHTQIGQYSQIIAVYFINAHRLSTPCNQSELVCKISLKERTRLSWLYFYIKVGLLSTYVIVQLNHL